MARLVEVLKSQRIKVVPQSIRRKEGEMLGLSENPQAAKALVSWRQDTAKLLASLVILILHPSRSFRDARW